MTPEERADKALRQASVDYAAYPERKSLNIVADAIREAVAEERERCAKAAETCPFTPAQMDDGARRDIAERIRSSL